MNIKYKRSIMLFGFYSTLLLSLCAFQCEDDDCDEEHVRNIAKIVVETENIKKQYNHPDTVWFKTEFESDIVLNNGETMDIDGFSCYIHQRLMKVEADGHVEQGARAFDYVQDIGRIFYDTIQQGESNLWTYQAYIEFKCQSGICSFKMGYVPKEAGVYAIETSWGGFYPDSAHCGLRNEFRDNEVIPSSANLEVLRNRGIRKIILPDNSTSGRWLSLDADNNLIVLDVR